MNKNSRAEAAIRREAIRAKVTEYKVKRPVGNYHNHENGAFTEITREVSFGNGTVSQNTFRNMQMCVLQNPGDCRTVHCAIDPQAPVRHKNIGYVSHDPTKQIGYFQPRHIKPAESSPVTS
jgi:hypothetical protein